MSEIKKLFGIDSLYFFCEANENYDNLFLDILDQLEHIKGKFDKKEIAFENRDLYIHINDIPLNYLGKAEGFYWFKDANEFFKIGFKSYLENRGLNDIRVQLQANGIYTIGITSLIELISKEVLNGFITDYFPITRADLNCFIQYDLSFITKEMFATRKRNYATISEIGNANNTQTIYIGKEPFKLRIYNKSLELKQSKKFDLMNEYFANNGFAIEKTIFNIEFQMHRTYLREFHIKTIQDLFEHAHQLFKIAMESIRLLDMDSVSKERIKNNKYQAITHPLWEEIKREYTLEEFLQSSIPIERLKRKVSVFSDTKFEYEFIILLRKAFINNLTLDKDYITSLYVRAKESLTKTTSRKEIKKDYIEVDITNLKNETKHYRHLKDGSLIEPVNVVSVCELQDYDLLVYLEKSQENQHKSVKDKHIYEVAFNEALKRGLIPNIGVHDFDKDL